MPLLKLQTSVLLPEDEQDTLIRALSKLLAEATGKPERYVMVLLEEGRACMAGKMAPAAFADVRGIGGLTPEVNADISARLAALLREKLDIPAENVYLNFTDVAAENWGWNGRTFA